MDIDVQVSRTYAVQFSEQEMMYLRDLSLMISRQSFDDPEGVMTGGLKILKNLALTYEKADEKAPVLLIAPDRNDMPTKAYVDRTVAPAPSTQVNVDSTGLVGPWVERT